MTCWILKLFRSSSEISLVMELCGESEEGRWNKGVEESRVE